MADIESDDNCEFRTMTMVFGFFEDNWLQVKKNLTEKYLHTSILYYMAGRKGYKTTEHFKILQLTC